MSLGKHVVIPHLLEQREYATNESLSGICYIWFIYVCVAAASISYQFKVISQVLVEFTSCYYLEGEHE